jgi:hypothetical protein
MLRVILFLLPCVLSAEPYWWDALHGEYLVADVHAIDNSLPGWWTALHGDYIAPQVREQDKIVIPVPELTGVTVSFSPQGSLPWLPKNVDIDYLVICGPSGTSVPSGMIYQLADANGITPLSPAAVTSLLGRKKALNPWSIAIEVGKDASIGIPVLGQGKIISMSASWVVALLSGHVLFDNVQNQVESRIPDPGPTISILLDPKGTLTFSNSCSEATIGVLHKKVAVAGTFRLTK